MRIISKIILKHKPYKMIIQKKQTTVNKGNGDWVLETTWYLFNIPICRTEKIIF